MKLRNSRSNSTLLNISSDQRSRSRLKSQNTVKPKPTYVQQLSKKLDDILSTDKKYNAVFSNTKSFQSENVPNSNVLQNQTAMLLKEQDRPKKVTMCRMFSILKTCKNGDNCNFAHGHKELDIEYKPVEWVKIFRRNASISGVIKIRDAHTTHSEIKRSEMSRINHSISISAYQSPKNKENRDNRDSSVNKIINTKGRTLLIEATTINDIETVKTLVRQGAVVSQKDWLGNDSIYYAIKSSNPVLLEALIKGSHQSLSMDEQFTTSRFSYLILAAKMSSGRMLEILLINGADPNLPDRYNRIALFYCVERNFGMGVNILLSHSSEINRIDTSGRTPLDYAFEKNSLDILSTLIKAGGLSSDSNINKRLILTCAQYNLRESVDELMRKGMSLNVTDEDYKKGNNVLMVAYESQNFDLLENILHRYNVRDSLNQRNKRGDNLLLRAIKDQNVPLVALLLENANIDITLCDSVGKNLLMYAAELGDYQTTETLIAKGLNPMTIDKYGRNALILACKNNHVFTVEVILKHEVNVLWSDNLNKTAKQYTSSDLIKKLLKMYMVENNQLSESMMKGIINTQYELNRLELQNENDEYF